MAKSKEDKKLYHKNYYQQNLERLQSLSRERYWRLKNDNKSNLQEGLVKKKKEIEIKIIKGDFVLTFD
jgi:hypothetical protein